MLVESREGARSRSKMVDNSTTAVPQLKALESHAMTGDSRLGQSNPTCIGTFMGRTTHVLFFRAEPAVETGVDHFPSDFL